MLIGRRCNRQKIRTDVFCAAELTLKTAVRPMHRQARLNPGALAVPKTDLN